MQAKSWTSLHLEADLAKRRENGFPFRAKDISYVSSLENQESVAQSNMYGRWKNKCLTVTKQQKKKENRFANQFDQLF